MAMRKNTKPLQLGRTPIILTYDYLALGDKINSQKLSYEFIYLFIPFLTTWTLKGHFFHFYPFWVILKAMGSPFNHLHFIFKPSLKKKGGLQGRWLIE